MRLSKSRAVVHGGLALLFFVFAGLQLNDINPAIYHRPSVIDAAMWSAFYALIGGLMIVSIWKRIPIWILLIAALLCLVEMVVTGPGLVQNLRGEDDFTMTGASMNAEDPRVELTREFFGAVIALAGVGFLWWSRKE
ncbi:MAG: transmembrane 220 family protein [Verrucomicrobiota bacterium]